MGARQEMRYLTFVNARPAKAPPFQKKQRRTGHPEGLNQRLGHPSKEYKFWNRHNWNELRKEFLTKRGKNGSYLYPQLADFIQAKWQDPNEQHYAKLIIGPRPKKTVPWEGFFAMERNAEAWEREQKVREKMDELEAELEEFTAFAKRMKCS
jgi:hypothetical protein